MLNKKKRNYRTYLQQEYKQEYNSKFKENKYDAYQHCKIIISELFDIKLYSKFAKR